MANQHASGHDRYTESLSVISSDLRVNGDLISESDVQVDGSVIGDIRTKKLTIGQNGSVRGEIIAENVRVCGSINGQIRATHVSLAETAHVVGDILHETLSIDPGAFLEGHCRRLEGALGLEESTENGLKVIQAGQVVAANVKKDDKR